MKRWFALGGMLVLWAACGGTAIIDGNSGGASSSTTSSSATTSSSSSSASTGAGGCGSNSGDCDSDGDCLEGADCVPLTPCGYRVCSAVVGEATSCGQPSIDECCDSSDCAQGNCYLWPYGPLCGGVQPVPHNVCAVDECTVDAECPASPQGIALCAPADTLGSPVRHCLFATCRTDSDCNEQPGGICATITDPCCSSPNALACVYPGDGCRSQQDCNDGTHCAIEDARARCLPGLVTCPA